MSVSVVASGSADSGVSSALTLSVTVPAGAAIGDRLIVQVAGERSIVPTVAVGGGVLDSVPQATADASLMTSVVGWKVLIAADIGSTVVATVTTGRRMAMAALVVRGGATPTIASTGYVSATTGVLTGLAVTPAGNDALLVSLVNCRTPTAPFTRTFTAGGGWTAAASDQSTLTTAVNALVHASYRMISGGSGVSQTAEALGGTSGDWEYQANTLAILPAVTPPTLTASQADTATVTATGTAGSGGTLAYSIAQTAGTTTSPALVSAGKWTVLRHAVDTLGYTVTVTESPSGLTAISTVTIAKQGATGGDTVRVRNATNDAWV